MTGRCHKLAVQAACILAPASRMSTGRGILPSYLGLCWCICLFFVFEHFLANQPKPKNNKKFRPMERLDRKHRCELFGLFGFCQKVIKNTKKSDLCLLSSLSMGLNLLFSCFAFEHFLANQPKQKKSDPWRGWTGDIGLNFLFVVFVFEHFFADQPKPPKTKRKRVQTHGEAGQQT